MKNFYFFTDITTDASQYCLLNINRLEDKRTKDKKLIFIDPGVYELTKTNEYSQIELLHEIAQTTLPANYFLSIDYPCDMNEKYTWEFIEKSRINNCKYKYNSQYICTIQSQLENFTSFKYEFDFLYERVPHNKIWGIGNLCRIMYPNTFTDKVMKYLLGKKLKWIHFYGLAMRLIRKYIPYFSKAGIFVSVDSTKWTRVCNGYLRKQYKSNCRKSNRNIFFLQYMKELINILAKTIIEKQTTLPL